MQATLFEKRTDIETVVLYALGDFQSRGKVLADRELAYDRLRGAFLRAFAKFGLPEASEEEIVAALKNLGAAVTEIPRFVAKRPYRIVVPADLASRSSETFRSITVATHVTA